VPTEADCVLQEWEGVELKTIPYKDSGTCIIGGVDDVQAILDDQIVKVQAINASPFVEPFRERSSAHESALQTLQERRCSRTVLLMHDAGASAIPVSIGIILTRLCSTCRIFWMHG
jgi:hypothetical protein